MKPICLSAMVATLVFASANVAHAQYGFHSPYAHPGYGYGYPGQYYPGGAHPATGFCLDNDCFGGGGYGGYPGGGYCGTQMMRTTVRVTIYPGSGTAPVVQEYCPLCDSQRGTGDAYVSTHSSAANTSQVTRSGNMRSGSATSRNPSGTTTRQTGYRYKF